MGIKNPADVSSAGLAHAVLLIQLQERILSEILLAAVDSSRQDPQKLSVEILLDRKAFVGGENTDFVQFTSFQEDGSAIRIVIRRIPDISICRRVFVFRVPHGATVIQIIGE